MTARKDTTSLGREPPIFSAVLTPHRSMGATGLLVLMAVIGLSSFGAGIAFWLIGAWPVVGFMGLDVALVYVAFRINNRAARAFEEVELSRDELLVRKVDRKGKARDFRFHPYWARLEVDRTEDGVAAISIRSHGRRLPVGRFLAPADRESFAKALGNALATARATPDQNPPPLAEPESAQELGAQEIGWARLMERPR